MKKVKDTMGLKRATTQLSLGQVVTGIFKGNLAEICTGRFMVSTEIYVLLASK